MLRRLSLALLMVGFAAGCSAQSEETSADRIRAYLNEEACSGQTNGLDDPWRGTAGFINPDSTFTVSDPGNVDYIGQVVAPSDGLSLARFKVVPPSSPPVPAPFPPLEFYVERNGTKVVAHQVTFSDDIGMVRLSDGKLAGIDRSGRFVLKPGSLPDYRIGRFYEGRAVFYTTSQLPDDRRWLIPVNKLVSGCIDKTGKVIFSSNLYTIINRFSDKLALVQVKNTKKFGFLDLQGHLAIPARFDQARDFSDGLAAVRLNGTWGFINGEGKEIITPKFEDCNSFEDGRAPVLVGKKWGYIDKAGTTVIEPRFNFAGEFSQGLAPVSLDEEWDQIRYKRNGHYGFIDSTGVFKIQARYLAVSPFYFGIARVCEAPDLATDLLFKGLGFIVPAQVHCAERYIDQNGNYFSNYKNLR